MIVREHDGQTLILSEPDVARLATTLAENFGNHRFAAPERSVIRALERLGFLDRDATVHPGPGGLPVDRAQLRWTDLLAGWTRATRPGGERDDEALLLTSIVVMRLAADASPPSPAQASSGADGQLRLQFETNKFVHAQVELQENLRRRLGLATDRPLRLGIAESLDDPTEFALSLQVRLLQCLWQMAEQLARGSAGITNPVFVADTGDFDRVRLRPVSQDRCLVSPWCFASDALTIDRPFRAWSQADAAGVQYAALPIVSLPLRLVPRP